MPRAPEPDPLFPAAHGPRDPVITALRPLAGPHGEVSILAGRRRLATLGAESAARLDLREGTPWTAALAAAVAEERDYELARRRAVSLLARRGLTRSELIERLAAKGVAPGAAARAADHLQRLGLLDDAAVADEEVRRIATRGPAADRLVEARLAKREVAPDLASKAVAAAAAGRTERDRALEAARTLLERDRPACDPAAAARRTLSALARRGFDEETAREALDAALRDHGLRLPTDESDGGFG